MIGIQQCAEQETYPRVGDVWEVVLERPWCVQVVPVAAAHIPKKNRGKLKGVGHMNGKHGLHID